MAELDRETSVRIVERLLEAYPDARCQLHFTTPFELLVATMLSAQCTDERVNMVTPRLFAKYRGPEAFAKASPDEVAEDIREVGLFRSKSKHIVETARILVEAYGGEVPNSRDRLMELPGVGRKTANVVVSNAYGVPAFAVDTHVQRVTNRIGLAHSSDPLKTEQQVCAKLPPELWTKAHHALILHGRRVCTARKPKCHICPVADLCQYARSQAQPKAEQG
ncbi:MAG: endonuclease III [Alicyclobacillus mali]|uniref:endonuclease III n=1 Tax=Alicyclobacillus mali (ex Roth et al. 2021) TaxID=1123961 RepID=UPI0023F4AEFB|nr:endonuclease III [Alicyclobacillus mali (ex Roth et al. 2021)]MCL6489283.1 endonuclease III [Alicyclobacillus mali (ex Roth et al. 2021)]